MLDGEKLYAHRASWIFHFGPIPNGLHVLHRCDVRNCLNPTHLFLGNHLQNMQDMVKKGRGVKGETHGRCKITEQAVREIRENKNGEPQRELAARFGIARQTISKIQNRKKWAHVI